MNDRYTYVGLYFSVGFAFFASSLPEWISQMLAEVVLLGLSVFGLMLISLGFWALTVAWAEGFEGPFFERYVCKSKEIEKKWAKTFVFVITLFLTVFVTSIIENVRISSTGVSIVFDYPSHIDVARGNIYYEIDVNNETSNPIVLSDFRIISLETNSKIYTPYYGIERCEDPLIIAMGNIDDTMNPIGSKPIVASGPNLKMVVLKAQDVFLNGSSISPRVISLPPKQGVEIHVQFPSAPRNYTLNTEVGCPKFRVFGGPYGRKIVTCRGFERIFFDPSEFTDRTSMLDRKKFYSMAQPSVGGVSVIYAHQDKTMYIRDAEQRGNCY